MSQHPNKTRHVGVSLHVDVEAHVVANRESTQRAARCHVSEFQICDVVSCDLSWYVLVSGFVASIVVA